MEEVRKNSEIYELDDRDVEILQILQDEGRIPITELADRIDLSHETVRYRIKKMEGAGVIEKYIARVNKKKLGYNIFAIIMIATWNYTEEEWQEFFDCLMENDRIVAVEKITGDYDIKIAFWAKTPEDMDSISHRIKTRFSDMIKDWQSFIFTKQYKWKELPF